MHKIYYRNIRSKSVDVLDAPKKGSWLYVVAPTDEEREELEAEYGFDPDLLKDGIDLYESPRLEEVDGMIYIYTRYCDPLTGETSTEPILIILTPDMLVTVVRKDTYAIQQLLTNNQTVTTQKIKLLLQIMVSINKGYRSHINIVTKQIFASRNRLQRSSVKNEDVIAFIDTEEDLNEFLAALQPYSIVLHALMSGRYFKLHEEDEDLIEDIQLSTAELIELTKSRLKTIQNMRDALSTIAANNLNMIFKRLTSIAIFMAIPTIVGGLYGMNVHLPFENHPQAFWIVVGVISTLVVTFVWYFDKRRWL